MVAGCVVALPLSPGSQIVVVSSGAALQGSPVSGGYAGAKRAQSFLASCANFDPPLSPAIMGQGILDLVTGKQDADGTNEFMITGKGLHPLGK